MTSSKTLAHSNRRVSPALVALTWLWVAFPFSYGVWQLLTKITQLFGT
jgi:hypothetical protein